jgi:hypothetical protein
MFVENVYINILKIQSVTLSGKTVYLPPRNLHKLFLEKIIPETKTN